MKLLSRNEAQSKIKKDNDELIGTNIRLRSLWKEITQRLNLARDDYDSEKMQKLRKFEEFCREILIKKSKLLEELTGVENAIKEKKELYYGLVVKQDILDERMLDLNEQEKKLEIRQLFLENLEKQFKEKTHADIHN